MSEPFNQWCIVEVMGHSKYAGLVTEQAIGGCNFVRVDVPEIVGDSHTEPRPAFTKLLGQGSIFSITPTSEQVAREAAKSFRSRQFEVFDLPRLAGPQQRDMFVDDMYDPELDDDED